MLSSGRQLVSASGDLPADASPMLQLPPSAEHTWQQVHRLLARFDEQSCLLPEVLNLAIYHYCVYKAFGQASAAALAQRLLQQVANQAVWSSELAEQTYSANWFDQACSAAWLSARFTAEGLSPAAMPALLADFDTRLLRHALNRHPPLSRQVYTQIVRYFTLRLADSTTDATAFLTPLLTASATPPPWTTQLVAPLAQMPVGLEYGLVAELRSLIILHQAGIQTGDPLAQLRHGIRSLLAERREVDFLNQKYSIFPCYAHTQGELATYSAALNWPHGDLGPALLLCEAYKLLNDSELNNISELVGLNTLLRTTPATTKIVSAQLYQGAAGTAHLYRKLHQVSGLPAYEQGTQFWLGRTHELLQQELVKGVYLQRENNLRYGLVGIGLVLLSAVAEGTLDWDATLL